MKQTFTDQNPSQLPASIEVAGGPITFAATVRAPAYAKPVFDALTRHCLHTGTDVGGLMGVMLAVAVRDYLEIKGVRV